MYKLGFLIYLLGTNMFNKIKSFFTKEKQKPRKTILRTSQPGFQDKVFHLKMTDEEVEVFMKVYDRSWITFIIK